MVNWGKRRADGALHHHHNLTNEFEMYRLYRIALRFFITFNKFNATIIQI